MGVEEREHDPIAPPGEDPVERVTEGPADRLRRRYEQLQADQHRDFDIPGYAGELVGRYVPIDEKELKASVRKLSKIGEHDRNLIAAIDLLIDSCREMFFRGEDGELVALSDDGDPVSYDDRLAALLGFEAEKRRSVVRKVFTQGGNFNAPALVNHAQEVGAWMADVSQEVDVDFAGE